MHSTLALSIGDPGSATPVVLGVPSVDALLNDPNIIQHVIGTVLTLAFTICLLLIVIFNVYNGYKYIVSQGEKKEIEQVRTAFWNGILGFIVLCLSFLVINLIGYFFNVNLLQINLP